MKRSSLVLAMLMAGSLGAAENDPLYAVSVTDVDRSLERLAGSIYNHVYQALPEAARSEIEANIAQGLAEANLPAGVDATALLRSIANGSLTINTIDLESEAVDAQGRLGLKDSAPIQAILAAAPDLQTAPAPEGALGSWQANEAELLLFSDRLIFSIPGDQVELATPPIVAPDYTVAVNLERLHEAILNAARDEGEPAAVALLEAIETFPSATGSFTILPHGSREEATISHRLPGLMPLDIGQLDRLPDNMLYLAAIGFDAGAFWSAWGDHILNAVAAEQGQPPAAINAVLDQQIAASGLAPDLATFLAGIKGQLTIAVRPSIPFPSLTVILPRSEVLDGVYGLALAVSGNQMPATGTSALFTPPQPIPVAITMAADDGALLISSDPMLPRQWLAGETGGWTGSPAAQRALAESDQPFALECADTAGILGQIKPWLPMLVSARPDLQSELGPDALGTITALIDVLINESKPGFTVGYHQDAGMRFAGEGLLGSVNTSAVYAALLMPAIAGARQNAQSVATSNTMRQLAITVISFQADEGRFPASIDEMADAFELSPDSLRSPMAPDDPTPFRYVRPAVNAGSMQPLLVTNPEHFAGDDVPVVFCDGHVETVDGFTAILLWTAAESLSMRNGDSNHAGATLTNWQELGFDP